MLLAISVGLGRKIFGRGHRQSRGNSGDTSRKSDQLRVVQGKGETSQRTGKLHKRIIQSQYNRTHIRKALLVYHRNQLLFVLLLLLAQGHHLGEILIAGIHILRLRFAVFHQLDCKCESEYPGQHIIKNHLPAVRRRNNTRILHQHLAVLQLLERYSVKHLFILFILLYRRQFSVNKRRSQFIPLKPDKIPSRI